MNRFIYVKKDNVLITGISGFVGTNLTNYLKRESDKILITGCSRNPQILANIDNKLHGTCSVDELLSNSITGNGFHSYVHLAGKVYNTGEKTKAEDFFQANYQLTKQLFHRFCEDKVAKKFIFLSTIHVLTENPKVVLDESYEPKPFTPYGKSKYKAETYILENSPPDKQVYILRPSMIHGPGNKGNLNSLYRLIKSGIPYPLRSINNKRSFVSIENLCFIIQQIVENDIDPGLYHVADDDPTFTHDLIRLIAEESGKKAKIWNVHPGLIYLIAKLGNVLPLPLNEYRYNKLVGNFIVSNQKLVHALGKPLPVSSNEGLRRTIKSLMNKAE